MKVFKYSVDGVTLYSFGHPTRPSVNQKPVYEGWAMTNSANVSNAIETLEKMSFSLDDKKEEEGEEAQEKAASLKTLANTIRTIATGYPQE